MFKVTVSEKGGAERELFFEEEEVSIGRLQGNSVVLPKPNVSKRHATIIFRDGKVTIVDQQSTNGTYVNGRRISSPKELADKDRIYIGDYTIRCGSGDAEEASEPSAEVEVISEEAQQKPTVAVPALPPEDELSGQTPMPIDLDVEIVTDEVVSSSDLEPVAELEDSPVHIPEIPPELFEEAVEAVEAIEAGQRSPVPEGKTPIPEVDLADLEEASVSEVSIPADAVVEEVTEPGADIEETVVAAEPPSAGLSQRLKKLVRPEDPGDIDRHREALRTVADRAAVEIFASVAPDVTDFPDDEWNRLSDSVLRLVDQLRRNEIIPSDVDPYTISQDLLFEFTGLGPLEEVLGNENIRRVLVDGPGRLFVVRANGKKSVLDRSFVSQDTMERVITKLANLAGITTNDGESLIEGRLPDGTHMMVLRPPLVTDRTALVFERALASSLTSDDLVGADVMSESCRHVLQKAMENNRNLFVCGPPGSGKSIFLNALLQHIPDDDRVVVVERRKELTTSQGDVVSLSKDFLCAPDGPGPGIATRLLPDVVIVSELEASDTGLLTILGLYGLKGLVLSTVASSAEDCLQRIEHLIAFSQPALDTKSIRALVHQITDLIVVLETTEDGRSHVSELKELDRKGKLSNIET